jgi:hypothetical protein
MWFFDVSQVYVMWFLDVSRVYIMWLFKLKMRVYEKKLDLHI